MSRRSTTTRFDVHFPAGRFAVACSGGSDSMALALLAKDAGADFIALIVDHRLRPESAEEALWVKSQLAARGIAAEILTYTGAAPKSNIEAKAREYRYRLLVGYCKTHGIGALVVAHNADEQAETFLLALVRGSGVRGLSAMDAESEMNGVRVARPLLDITKEELRLYLESKGQKWVEDPSNFDERYMRVKVRRLAAALASLGLKRERTIATARNMRSAAEALDHYAARLEEEAVLSHSGREIRLSRRAITEAAPAVALGALGRIFAGARPIRAETLERVLAAIASGGKMTFAGWTVGAAEGGRIAVAKRRPMV